MSAWLFDTNVTSETVRPHPSPLVTRWLQNQPKTVCYTSVICVGEIRRGIALAPSELRRNILEDWFIKNVLPMFAQRVLMVDLIVAERWGDLSAAAQRNGVALSESDGLIAATALVHNLTLVTRNVKDFAATGVTMLNPWEL